MKDFLAEVKSLFEAPLQTKSLHAMSRQLQKEFRQKLKASNMCMLPSFHHTLPTGREKATILALDVGGSTFRIALIELSGRDTCQGVVKDDGMEIKRLKSVPIDNSVRSLEGRLFFDWMADRIDEVLDADNHQADNNADGPLPMALAWSFPIEQTSTRSGRLLAMGKGFLATAGVEGHDICDLVTAACQKRKLNLSLQAIVNDSSATLLSQAYRDSTTRISLIMGTGINAAIYLPISTLEREKFESREQSWWDEANHVLVNTELSMFGGDIWNATRWDDDLNQKHQNPDFQPLEYKTGGRYLGELVRLVIVEAVEKGVLFGGYLPMGLDVPYALDTGLVAVIEGYVFAEPLISPKLTLQIAINLLVLHLQSPLSQPLTHSPTHPPEQTSQKTYTSSTMSLLSSLLAPPRTSPPLSMRFGNYKEILLPLPPKKEWPCQTPPITFTGQRAEPRRTE